MQLHDNMTVYANHFQHNIQYAAYTVH